jgi:hypothetical protein
LRKKLLEGISGMKKNRKKASGMQWWKKKIEKKILEGNGGMKKIKNKLMEGNSGIKKNKKEASGRQKWWNEETFYADKGRMEVRRRTELFV